jgi:hypothetical protein
MPHLLWHGTSVSPVSSEGPPHSVDSYDTHGMRRIYFNLDPHGVGLPINRMFQYTRQSRTTAKSDYWSLILKFSYNVVISTYKYYILIDYLWFYVPLKNFSLIWRRHHSRWRAAKFRPMFSAQGPRAGRGPYRATPTVTRGLCFSGLIRRTGVLLKRGTENGTERKTEWKTERKTAWNWIVILAVLFQLKIWIS